MELASMLAGEHFTDHPKVVCPTIASLLRAYNDEVDEDRRTDLYRCAANSVGTRVDRALAEIRASEAIHWARVRYETRAWWQRTFQPSPEAPRVDDGPDEIAGYVVGALGGANRGWRIRRGGWSDETHGSFLRLVDRLIAMGPKHGLDELLAELTVRVRQTARRTRQPERAVAV